MPLLKRWGGRVFSFSLFFLAGLCATAQARFDLIDHSARATARGGAFVATADDGGAFYYNPAGLTKIPGNLAQSDVLFAFRDTEYESPAGAGEKITQTITLPNLYVAVDTGNESWKWGVGVFMPFGSSTEWSENGPLRYAATFSQLKTWVVNPAVAYRASDTLSLGCGIDIYSGEVILRKMINYGASVPGAADGKYELVSEEAYAAGYNLGALWQITPRSRLGVSYRSRFEMMFKGQATITDKPVPPYVSSRETTSAKAKYNFPDVFMIGAAYDLTEKLTVEADFQWTNWSEYNGYYLDFDPNTASLVDQWTERNYHDSLVYKVGGEYALSEVHCLRLGAAYASEAVPATTHSATNAFDPANPSNRRYSGYIGWGYHRYRFRLDIVVGFTKFADRFVDNGAGQSANGTYTTIIPQAGIGVGWMF